MVVGFLLLQRYLVAGLTVGGGQVSLDGLDRPRPFGKLPHVWLGANFWSRTGGPLMWRSYDAGVVREELAVLRDHGLNMTRSFFYWPDFMPEPDRVDETLVAHYADFLDAHHELGMTTVPTYIVGHMSGENWDPAWRDGRDLYGDVWLVARQAWFIRTMTERLRRPPGRQRLADQQRDAALRRTGRRRHRDGVGAARDARGAGRRRHAAGRRSATARGAIEVTGRDNGFSVRAPASWSTSSARTSTRWAPTWCASTCGPR